MNRVLFSNEESLTFLPRQDPRAEHLLRILRRTVGDTFDAGLADGPAGKGRIEAITPEGLALSFSWGAPPPLLPPVSCIVGLPRPQTARKILAEAASVGVSRIDFVTTERGEPSYASSSLWTSGEWRRHLIAGVEQAFCTRLPEVSWNESLAARLAALPPGTCRIALDNYEAPYSLADVPLGPPVVVVAGSERGWSPAERLALLSAGCAFAHLGARVLRTETAVVAALAVIHARLGHWREPTTPA